MQLDTKPKQNLAETALEQSRKAYRATSDAVEAAIVALVDSGVAVGRIEILGKPMQPGAWIVRERRAVCKCGRAV